MTATWPLWWGQSSFPAIPLINSLVLPVIVDRIVVCVLLAACVLIAGSQGKQRWDRNVRIAGLAAALILCISNQHRLQAWHWLFLLGLGTSLFKPEQGLQLLRSILASVYVCSALSRIGPTAHQGMSAAIVDQLLRVFHFSSEASDGSSGEVLCHALNFSELSIGVMLILPMLRRYGILSAMLLHASLLLALGPLGLGHHRAVLIWNVCFLCLIPLVFPGTVADLPSTQTGSRRAKDWRTNKCRLVVDAASIRTDAGSVGHDSYFCAGPNGAALIFVWLFPLSGLIGIADNWPAWQLYSTRPETWTLQIHEADVQYLDQDIQPYVSKPAPLDDWVVVKLDRWSLAETGSPVYPEDRFQKDLIRRVLSTFPAEAEFRIDISEPERWFWWRRIHRTVETFAELNAE